MIIPQASDAAKMHLVVLASGMTTFVLMVAVTFYHGNGRPLLGVVISLLTAQLGIITLVLIVSQRPFAEGLWHAALYACGIYYAIFLPPALAADRFGYAAMPTANLGIGILGVYALAVAGVLRASGLRLLLGQPAEASRPAEKRPPQYRLIDLMKWVTLIGVAMGLRTTVISQFMSPKPLVAWLGIFYAYDLPSEGAVGGVTFLLGGPVMLVNLIVFGLALSDRPLSNRAAIGLTVMWVLLAGAILVTSQEHGSMALTITGFALPLFFLPALLHAWVMRRLGWRMVSSRRADQG